MANVVHLGRKEKQKAAAIVLGRAPRREMRTVHAQQKLKNAKIPLVPTIYHAKSGNVAALNQ